MDCVVPGCRFVPFPLFSSAVCASFSRSSFSCSSCSSCLVCCCVVGCAVRAHLTSSPLRRFASSSCSTLWFILFRVRIGPRPRCAVTMSSRRKKKQPIVVPSLSSICIRVIADNFREFPVAHRVSDKSRHQLLATLPLDVDVATAAEHIHDEGYWERRCKANTRWKYVARKIDCCEGASVLLGLGWFKMLWTTFGCSHSHNPFVLFCCSSSSSCVVGFDCV